MCLRFVSSAFHAICAYCACVCLWVQHDSQKLIMKSEQPTNVTESQKLWFNVLKLDHCESFTKKLIKEIADFPGRLGNYVHLVDIVIRSILNAFKRNFKTFLHATLWKRFVKIFSMSNLFTLLFCFFLVFIRHHKQLSFE